MASRRLGGLLGARWWSANPGGGPAALLAAAGLACTGASTERPKLLRADAGKAEQDASKLAAFHLATWQQEVGEGIVHEKQVNKYLNPMAVAWPHMNFLNPDELVMGHIIFNDSKQDSRPAAVSKGCVRGNACKEIWWDPGEVRAAVVTCGRLCPGLNSIIREVTNSLWHQYGVKHIYGIQAGYNGLSKPELHRPIQLTPDKVSDIHMKGGSILKAGRGGFDAPRICDRLEQLGINMVFTVGGDGTQFASHQLYEEAKRRNLPVSIVGIPKSIDNDILFFDKTFGFDTAVAAASKVIRNSWVEATSHEHGVGIVKLMGRDAGFVAMHAALASTIVDLVMIPEVKVKLEDVMDHIDVTLSRKNFMVIAVAEGAGQEFVATGKTDATGQTVYSDVGTFMRDAVNKHLKGKGSGRSFYIDPSYIIRSVPILPNDHIYCARLARDAVHTAMRGYTGVCVGPIHNIIVIMPAQLIASGKKSVNVTSSAWQSCVQSCNMPLSLTGL